MKSKVYPDLERVPGKQNWVDKSGGLPSYIERIAKHLHYEKGMDIGRAIAVAVNTVKRWASSGSVTEHGSADGRGSGKGVSAATRAKAAKAVAEWEAKKAASHKNMGGGPVWSDDYAIDLLLSTDFTLYNDRQSCYNEDVVDESGYKLALALERRRRGLPMDSPTDKHGNELKVGDTVEYDGEHHVINHFSRNHTDKGHNVHVKREKKGVTGNPLYEDMMMPSWDVVRANV